MSVSRGFLSIIVILVSVAVGTVFYRGNVVGAGIAELAGLGDVGNTSFCPLPTHIRPEAGVVDKAKWFLLDPGFKAQSLEKLAGAVRVPTEVGDGWPSPNDDPGLWRHMIRFHEYLESTFPKLHKTLTKETVNTYGLVYTWEGSDSSLKPLLLAAHQDVVPVQEETVGDWKFPPFSGHITDEYVYGRGSFDCKNLLIALMEAVEELIDADFKPKRTIILLFGFDEESLGYQGAHELSKFLLDRYGPDSFYALFDEGLVLTPPLSPKSPFVAIIPAGEKGLLNVEVGLTTPGGHSLLPPDHTSIGIMSDLVVKLEREAFTPVLANDSPMLKLVQCMAEHDESLPKMFRRAALTAHVNAKAHAGVVYFLSRHRLAKYLIRTSQSVDVVNGGAKSNALPEHVSLVVNHRIAIEELVKLTLDHLVSKVQAIAEEYDVGLAVYDQEILPPTPHGYFNVTYEEPLEPAPVSPSFGDPMWEEFAGVLRHFYEEVVEVPSELPVVVSPGLFPANTDTRHYWSLTRNIYRVAPGYFPGDLTKLGIHSVNEKVPHQLHIQLVAWYWEYLQVVA